MGICLIFKKIFGRCCVDSSSLPSLLLRRRLPLERRGLEGFERDEDSRGCLCKEADGDGEREDEGDSETESADGSESVSGGGEREEVSDMATDISSLVCNFLVFGCLLRFTV